MQHTFIYHMLALVVFIITQTMGKEVENSRGEENAIVDERQIPDSNEKTGMFFDASWISGRRDVIDVR
jgi:hypothetical protein